MFLMFGRESKLPIDLMFEDVLSLQDRNHQKFVRDWKESMKEAMRIAQVNMEKSSDLNKLYRDQKEKIVEVKGRGGGPASKNENSLFLHML